MGRKTKCLLPCAVCGKPFSSRFNGIPCCSSHYAIAYRLGDPFADTTRKPTNTFIETPEYYIGKTAKGLEYVFDKRDYDKISGHSWCLSKTGYLVANIHQKVVKLHRFMLGIDKGIILDHINHNPLDNRRCNLRIVTPKNNARNTSVSKSNKVGALGVSTTKSGKYRARIMVDGKEIRLGNYDNLESAVAARRNGEVQYFGSYAPSVCRGSDEATVHHNPRMF